ncbi:MAG: hypothetical protein DRH26_17430 [Deltaproteobacteria bacterium]|nr:MAG: hypothetical protein DRH26_17430 [Deltaproteobacteria bacterium]
MSIRQPFLAFFLFIIISLVSVSSVYSADIPQTLNYQGNLTDNTGQPLSGTKQITFALYDVASGGTALWTETQTVTLKDGLFSVVLGSTKPLNADIFTGETFLGLKVESSAEMGPRQKLTSVAYALKSLEVVNLPNIPDPIPSGIIVMWSGSSDSIPQSWTLCDGNNGTPNLTDRFLIGAGNTYNVGDKGGSTTKDLSHTHTGPNHRHFCDWIIGPYPDGKDYDDSVQDDKDGDTPAGSDHQHKVQLYTDYSGTGNTSSAGSTTQDIMPPYYALCFIMKL